MKNPNQKLRWWLIPVFAFVFLSMVILFADLWYIRTYGRTNFDSILFTITSDLSGTSSTLIWQYVLQGLLPALVVSGGLITGSCVLVCRGRLKRWIVTLSLCLLSLGVSVYAAFDAQLVDYLVSISGAYQIYEEEYHDPKDTVVTFPEEKRNLVYIVLESMETSFLCKELGGGVDNNLIPELYELAKNNVNFSQNADVGGFRQSTGATWSIGSLVSQTSGVPLVPMVAQNEESTDGQFLPGLTTMMDMLHENGYYQAFMLGSSADFADTGLYYEVHGVDKIYDIYTAWHDGVVANGYWDGWWGMEDYHLFEYAKQELTRISQQDQPFAFTLMTIDTHHIGGNPCPYCGSDYIEQYDNVIACSSRQVALFVAWLQEQDFYENTTVVIVGDHNSMDAAYFDRNVAKNYVRRVYNCFINSAVEPEHSKHREFTTLDLFPTTLAALGCTIEGDRLGLGTNLFSTRPTLAERWGYDALCTRLYSNKDYYTEHFRSGNS